MYVTAFISLFIILLYAIYCILLLGLPRDPRFLIDIYTYLYSDLYQPNSFEMVFWLLLGSIRQADVDYRIFVLCFANIIFFSLLIYSIVINGKRKAVALLSIAFLLISSSHLTLFFNLTRQYWAALLACTMLTYYFRASASPRLFIFPFAIGTHFSSIAFFLFFLRSSFMVLFFLLLFLALYYFWFIDSQYASFIYFDTSGIDYVRVVFIFVHILILASCLPTAAGRFAIFALFIAALCLGPGVFARMSHYIVLLSFVSIGVNSYFTFSFVVKSAVLLSINSYAVLSSNSVFLSLKNFYF